MTRVICVAAGQTQTKKFDNAISRRHRYLNYGLLSLATVLARSGCDPVVIHGHFDPPGETLGLAENLGLADSRFPVLVSVPSFYAVGWAREFIQLAKARHRGLRVLVGGRWVVDGDPARLCHLIPEADQIIGGLGEAAIAAAVGLGHGVHWEPQARHLREPGIAPPVLDYRLLHNRHLYQPSVEVARGCGMGCSFCQERDSPLQPLKAAQTLVSELRQTLVRDHLLEMTPYLETSMFVPTASWAASLKQELERNELAVRWRTEGRVDNIQPELIPSLAQAGMKVLDLGLESASPTQLIRMRKTRSPSKYLDRATRLLQACARHDIRVKVNLLLYAGENDDTVAETLNWLDSRKEMIYGVSVGPVIAFGWPESVSGYLAELQQFGATAHHSPCPGVVHLNLSPEIDHESAKGLARAIGRRYMSASHYYRLKSFSYFARDYSFEAFLVDALSAPQDLSFHLQDSSDAVSELVGAIG